MKTKNSIFEAIGYIFSLIISSSFDSSVNTLAKTCNIPEQQILNYLSVLFDNRLLSSHFYPNNEIPDDDDDPDATIANFKKMILSGHYNDTLIYIVNMEDWLTDNFILLPISSVETSHLTREYPQLLQNNQTGPFEKKDTINSIPEHILKKQDQIQNAISQQVKIEFNYKSPLFDLEKKICSPVTVIQNLTSKIFYLKDTDNYYYRLDRIKSNIRLLKEKSEIVSYTPSPYQKYFWSTEYKEHGEPIHVRLRIAPETTNIIEKIKNDTAFRCETSKFYKEGNFYYYEDDILGIQDFRKWLRSYGSSITVLEPISLIEEIKKSSYTTIEYYNIISSKSYN